MKRVLLLLLLTPLLQAQQYFTAYVGGSPWAPWTATSGSGQISVQYPAAYLFCSSTPGVFEPCKPGSGGSGTVTSVSVTTANGVSGTVATATTTPAITLILGAITPTSIGIGGGTVQTGTQGTDTKLLTAGAVSGTAAALCTDANGGATTSGCSSGLGSQSPNSVAVGPSGIPGASSATAGFVVSPSPLYTHDPRAWIYWMDDFTGESTGNAFGTLFIWNDQCTTGSAQQGIANTYGVLRCATSAVSANKAYITANQASAGLSVFSGFTGDIIIRAALSGTSTITLFAGANGTSNVGEGDANYVGIAYDTASGDTGWMCVENKAGTKTRTAVAGTLDTNFHDFRLRFTSGVLNCSVDGGTETTLSGTNFPAVALSPEVSVITDTTAIEYYQIDYYYMAVGLAR